jgi:hypothetical protein
MLNAALLLRIRSHGLLVLREEGLLILLSIWLLMLRGDWLRILGCKGRALRLGWSPLGDRKDRTRLAEAADPGKI